jgi:hypothetical protein
MFGILVYLIKQTMLEVRIGHLWRSCQLRTNMVAQSR